MFARKEIEYVIIFSAKKLFLPMFVCLFVFVCVSLSVCLFVSLSFCFPVC